jgi:Domain of unknown function (DUF4190)
MKCGAALPQAEGPTPPPMAATAALPAQWPYPYVLVAQQRTAGVAVAALVFGIATFFVYFLGFIFAPVAIVLGIVGRHKVDDQPAVFKGRGMATAGVALGFSYMILATAIVSALVFTRLATLR